MGARFLTVGEGSSNMQKTRINLWGWLGIGRFQYKLTVLTDREEISIYF